MVLRSDICRVRGDAHGWQHKRQNRQAKASHGCFADEGSVETRLKVTVLPKKKVACEDEPVGDVLNHCFFCVAALRWML